MRQPVTKLREATRTILIPRLDREAFTRTEFLNVMTLGSKVQAAAALFRGTNSQIADCIFHQESLRYSVASVTVCLEQEQLQTAEARLSDETRPDLPVNFGTRRALLSQGKVGVFHNTSGRRARIHYRSR